MKCGNCGGTVEKHNGNCEAEQPHILANRCDSLQAEAEALRVERDQLRLELTNANAGIDHELFEMVCEERDALALTVVNLRGALDEIKEQANEIWGAGQEPEDRRNLTGKELDEFTARNGAVGVDSAFIYWAAMAALSLPLTKAEERAKAMEAIIEISKDFHTAVQVADSDHVKSWSAAMSFAAIAWGKAMSRLAALDKGV